MGEGTTEESGNGVAGDMVVSTRYTDGRITISLPMVKHDAESAARFCGQWVAKAQKSKTKALAINLADEKFINKARMETIVSSIIYGSALIQNLPSLLAIPVIYIKTYFRFLAKGSLEISIIKAAAEGKEIVLYLRFWEAPDMLFLEKERQVAVGLTAYPLRDGYEFKGKDQTNAYKDFKDISKEVVEWGCPDFSQWPLGAIGCLGGVSEDDLYEIIFPLVIMRQLSVEMKKNNARFRVMIIYESQIGRFVTEIDSDTLKKLGIIE